MYQLWHFGLFSILLFGFWVKFIESTDLYSLTVSDLQGNSVPMSVFKGKVSVPDYEGPYMLACSIPFFLLFQVNHVILYLESAVTLSLQGILSFYAVNFLRNRARKESEGSFIDRNVNFLVL